MASKNLTFLNDFDLEGYWWLPQYPDDLHWGKLRYTSGDQILLEALDSPNVTHDMSFGDDTEHGIVFGRTLDGRDCTLLDSFRRDLNIHVGGMSKHTFLTNCLILGQHYGSREEIQFSSLKVSFSFLDEWLEERPFRVERAQGSAAPRDLTASYESPQTFTVSVPSLNAEVSSAPTCRTNLGPASSLQVTHVPYLKIVPETPIKLDRCLHIVNELKRLLTLLVGQAVYVIQLTAKPVQQGEQHAAMSTDAHVFLIEERGESSRNVHASEMLATRPALGNDICKVFGRWFAMAKELRSVYYLFYGCIYRPVVYAESDFLSLMQALEAYHRYRFPGLYVEPCRYEHWCQVLIHSIPEEVPSDLRTALSSRFKYGNEYSLRKRMQELVRELPTRLVSLVTPDIDTFIGRIVGTRHYYTHLSEELRKAALRDKQLLPAIAQLRSLLAVLLLTEVGVDEAMIAERLPRTRFYRQYRENIR